MQTTSYKTFIDLQCYLSYTWKTGLTRHLFQRAKLICSRMILYDNQVKNLQNMFLHNRYPKHFFDVVIKTFEDVNEPKLSHIITEIIFI